MKRIPLTVTFALALFLTGCLARSRPNIVLIVIDTLRADHLSCYGYERPTSPRLDALAERAVLFESAAAVAPYTRASTASILTGVYPSVHGAITNDQDVISPTVQTLAEALQETGYRTHGFSRNANVRRAFGFARGFDTFERPAKPLSEKLKAEKGDDFLWREIDDSVLTRRV
ncbi:MAG: sulfatase-like hydrolase/transferase, partial [bacterium]|nr:sulfatase-like hydrolase/transferase [bacterium]